MTFYSLFLAFLMLLSNCYTFLFNILNPCSFHKSRLIWPLLILYATTCQQCPLCSHDPSHIPHISNHPTLEQSKTCLSWVVHSVTQQDHTHWLSSFTHILKCKTHKSCQKLSCIFLVSLNASPYHKWWCYSLSLKIMLQCSFPLHMHPWHIHNTSSIYA